MAENIPNLPGGAVPPKKETGKVQPKKETVRINLPPKPSAAPTIKLPTLPPGGPVVGGAPPTAPRPSAAAVAPSARAAAAPVATARPAATAAPRAAARPAQPAISGMDFGLAIGAAVAGLAAVVTTVVVLAGLS